LPGEAPEARTRFEIVVALWAFLAHDLFGKRLRTPDQVEGMLFRIMRERFAHQAWIG